MRSNTNEKVVGLLGGMGPEATIDIFQKIVTATNANKDEDHLRIIIDNNPKMPSRQDAILKGSQNPGPMMALTAQNLEKAGADFIIICANTAHYFYEDVQAAVGIEVLHIIKEAVNETVNMNERIKRVGVLATTGAMKANIFQTSFAEKGIEVIGLPDYLQKEIQESIFLFKYSSEKNVSAVKLLNAVEYLRERKVEAIIMGCTEIPIILRDKEFNIPFYDPNQIIADVAVRYAKGKGLS